MTEQILHRLTSPLLDEFNLFSGYNKVKCSPRRIFIRS